ncbi:MULTISPECIES: hypothetical protein [Methylorubrum]|uniref:hypothetical protein n=1 Tax=Methylorubrum TaxID=2282523 RepID=UPI00209E54F8|nr:MULTISPECIES: hypothetical protein [Methylorubrum]MCP1547253.1 hypothetical protein [Methylorubrum zatmanii]MCP1556131.1 hypothetical protein [Methylorubrum extorquens]MCP1577556.1 hypothetical protein [Methylorubrum extorquens]
MRRIVVEYSDVRVSGNILVIVDKLNDLQNFGGRNRQPSLIAMRIEGDMTIQQGQLVEGDPSGSALTVESVRGSGLKSVLRVSWDAQ